MSGRFVFTPARRAALKRAAQKSAAKRKGRGNYRKAKRQLSRNVNQSYARSGGGPKNLKAHRAKYDRGVNDLRVQHKGKKHRSDKFLKNKRTAYKAATVAVYVGAAFAPQIAGAVDNSVAKRKGNNRRKKAYKQSKNQHLKMRAHNLSKAGLNPDGSVGKKGSTVKVKSSRARGPQFASQRAIGAGTKKRKKYGASSAHR